VWQDKDLVGDSIKINESTDDELKLNSILFLGLFFHFPKPIKILVIRLLPYYCWSMNQESNNRNHLELLK